MSASRTEQAQRLRRWARLLREKADDPGAYQKALLHTIEQTPGRPPRERHCAYGLMELAAYPEGTPHNEIWVQSGTVGAGLAVYSATRGTNEHYPASETVEEMGLYPECNPFAMKELELGEDEPPDEIRDNSAPDLVFMPIDKIADHAAILGRGKGLVDLDGQTYVHLATVSDAGQKHWPDIAAFAEQRADEIEAEAQQPR